MSRGPGLNAFTIRLARACALRVKLVPRRELKPSIGAGQRNHESRVEKAVGLDHVAGRPSHCGARA